METDVFFLENLIIQTTCNCAERLDITDGYNVYLFIITYQNCMIHDQCFARGYIMKKIFTLILSLLILCTGCSHQTVNKNESVSADESAAAADFIDETQHAAALTDPADNPDVDGSE